jgi:hypothetical protein
LRTAEPAIDKHADCLFEGLDFEGDFNPRAYALSSVRQATS